MEKVSGEDVYVGGTKWTRNTVERVYFGFGPMLRAIRHCHPVVAADATFLKLAAIAWSRAITCRRAVIPARNIGWST